MNITQYQGSFSCIKCGAETYTSMSCELACADYAKAIQSHLCSKHFFELQEYINKFIDNDIQPERLSEKTSKDDAIV